MQKKKKINLLVSMCIAMSENSPVKTTDLSWMNAYDQDFVPFFISLNPILRRNLVAYNFSI